MPTVLSTETDYANTKPAPQAGSSTATKQYLQSGAIDRFDVLNDLFDGFYYIDEQGQNIIPTATRGDRTVMMQIIVNAMRANLRLPVVSGYTVASGQAQPLVLNAAGTALRWTPLNTTNGVSLFSASTLAFDHSTRAANDQVIGSFVGSFTPSLSRVSSTGVATAKTPASADIGKAIYIVIGTSNAVHYALWEDIDWQWRYNARQIGALLTINANVPTVGYNTLIRPEQRKVQKIIWSGNVTSGLNTLNTGESFDDWDTLYFEGGKDATGSTGVRTMITVPSALFTSGGHGIQESFAADAYWNIFRSSHNQFRVTSNTRNLTTGVRQIIGER